MFCIKCHQKSTHITNSRPHKKVPTVWRRRHCTECQLVFTTDERPQLSAILVISNEKPDKPFNQGKLLISISKAFGHNVAKGEEVAWDLTETVVSKLAGRDTIRLTVHDITVTTYGTLRNYDETAAVQYGISHRLIAAGRAPKF